MPWTAPVAAAPVHGRVTVPGSKSASARSLVLSALADGPAVLTGVLAARDTALMRSGLNRLGAGFDDLPDGGLRVRPAQPVTGGGTVDCGLAGTVLRFLPPVAALAEPPTSFTGDDAASSRPVAALLGALAQLGAQVSQPHRLPFTVGGMLRGGRVSLDASGSSQFVSALLLAAPRFPEGLELTHEGGPLPSRPHIDMTCALLRRRGVQVQQPTANTWLVGPGPIAAIDEQVEPDLTNAATFLAAALATHGELATAWPDGSVQPADELAAALAAFGADLSYRGDGAGRELLVRGQGLRGVDLDLHAISEFTPVAAALAAIADGPSVLRGVAHIRGHETDRLAALASELTSLGVSAQQTADGLRIAPADRHGGRFRTYADHRLAHAGALVGLVTPGVELDDVGCTSKTLPDFPRLWAELLDGGR